jgi:uncharacterized membrane protein YeiH
MQLATLCTVCGDVQRDILCDERLTLLVQVVYIVTKMVREMACINYNRVISKDNTKNNVLCT